MPKGRSLVNLKGEIDIQTALDPEFNLATAENLLDYLAENDDFQVNGAYLRGSSAYGLALNSDAARYEGSDEEASDVDITIVVDGDLEENPDYVSDAYDAVKEFNERQNPVAEVEPGIVGRKKFEGALSAAGADFADDGETSEYIIISYPGRGDVKYEYPEFIRSLEERVPLRGIDDSRIESELRAGARLVDQKGANRTGVDEYMTENCAEKQQILEENLNRAENSRIVNQILDELGEVEKADIQNSKGEFRVGNILQKVVGESLSVGEIARIADGSFGDIQIDVEALGYRDSAELVRDRTSRRQIPIDVRKQEEETVFGLASKTFSSDELGRGYEQIVSDTVKGRVGSMLGEIDLRQNPNNMDVGDIIEKYYAGGVQSF